MVDGAASWFLGAKRAGQQPLYLPHAAPDASSSVSDGVVGEGGKVVRPWTSARPSGESAAPSALDRLIRALREAAGGVAEDDFHAAILLPTLGRVVARNGIALAATDRSILIARDAARLERIRHGLRTPLRQGLVVRVGPAAVGVTLDDDLRIGMRFQVVSQTVEPEVGARLQGRLTSIEQYIAQCDHQASIGLLGLKVRELLLRVGELLLGLLRLAAGVGGLTAGVGGLSLRVGC